MTDVEIKPQRYRDDRPKEHFDQYHARVRASEPEAKVYEVVRVLTVLHALITFRARGIGSENVPGGPVILAPNHASFMDHFFAGAFVRRRIQFMAKSQLFAPGPPQWIFSHGGVFPVRRGSADDEAFISAYKILERGGAIGMYCEGGRSRNGQLAPEAKPGIGRLALESGAPIVPVAVLGSYQVRNWKRLQFPRVTVSYGELSASRRRRITFSSGFASCTPSCNGSATGGRCGGARVRPATGHCAANRGVTFRDDLLSGRRIAWAAAPLIRGS